MNLKTLYVNSSSIPLGDIFVWPAQDHTMASSLNRYVENRLPADALMEVIERLKKVYILGIYPLHFDEVASELGFQSLEKLPFQPKPYTKRFNFIRPNFYLSHDKRTLYIAVPPGLAYLKQYSSLILHFLSAKRSDLDYCILHYPSAAERIAEWTGLNSEFFREDSICLIGHVDEFEQYTPEIKDLPEVTSDNLYYTRSTFRIGNKSIDLIGFKFSFWGDISGRLIEQLYANNSQEVIYFSKVGSLERYVELYKTIIIPRLYLIAEHDRIVRAPFSTENRLAEYIKSRSAHVSTPTVMEQGYIQRQAYDEFRPESIDNEIAYMALSAKQINDNRGFRKPVSFSSISFATDYVRRVDEHQTPSLFDLSNNRSTQALKLKQNAINAASKILYEYLSMRGVE